MAPINFGKRFVGRIKTSTNTSWRGIIMVLEQIIECWCNLNNRGLVRLINSENMCGKHRMSDEAVQFMQFNIIYTLCRATNKLRSSNIKNIKLIKVSHALIKE